MVVNAPHRYTPAPGSVPHQVCEFFRAHPDEELSGPDIRAKFDGPNGQITNVRNVLERCVEAGLIKHINGLYSAGHLLGQQDKASGGGSVGGKASSAFTKAISSTMNSAFAGSAAGFFAGGTNTSQAAGKTRTVRKPLPALDLAAITLRSDVPKPDVRTSQGSDWTNLLKRMQPGQSFEAPDGYAYAIGKTMTELHKVKAWRWSKRGDTAAGVSVGCIAVWRDQ